MNPPAPVKYIIGLFLTHSALQTGVSWKAGTYESIYEVRATSTVQTRIAGTFVTIFSNTHYKL